MAGSFCPACGQDASVSRLNLRRTLSYLVRHLNAVIFAAIGFFGENRGLTAFKCVVGKILNTVVVIIMVLILIVPRILDLMRELEAEKGPAVSLLSRIDQYSTCFHRVYGHDSSLGKGSSGLWKK